MIEEGARAVGLGVGLPDEGGKERVARPGPSPRRRLPSARGSPGLDQRRIGKWVRAGAPAVVAFMR